MTVERTESKLKAERIQQRLAELPGWEVGEGDGALVKSYVFPTVRAASLFAALVVEMGAAAGHVPTITQRRLKVEVEIATDFDGGLSELDLDLARFFDHTLTSSDDRCEASVA